MKEDSVHLKEGIFLSPRPNASAFLMPVNLLGQDPRKNS